MSAGMARDIAARLPRMNRSRDGYRGDCPSCGYTAALAIRDGRNGRLLAWCANGCGQDTLTSTLSDMTGGGWKPSAMKRDGDATERRERRRQAAIRLWNGGVPAIGTVADTYLAGRALPDLARSSALRFRADTPHPEGARLRALLAAVRGADGAMLGLHRGYLDAAGGKARVTPNRASIGPIWGGAIRLQEHDPTRHLLIGEGLETSASAGMMMGLPAWSALSAGNLGKGLALPPEVRRIVVAVDPDPPGERAAEEAAARWMAEGRRVQLAHPQGGGDFNDVLMRMKGAIHAGR